MTTNIFLRGSRRYLRIAVPRDLQKALGKKEVWQSLRTGDHKEARRVALIAQEAIHRDWESLRQTRLLNAADIEHAIWDRYVLLIASDDRFRDELPSDADLTEIWNQLTREFGDYNIEAYRIYEIIRQTFDTERQSRSERLSVLRQHSARGETRSVAEITDDLLAKSRLAPANSADRKKLASGLLRAELEAHLRFAERDTGNFSGRPSDPLVQPPKRPKAVVVPAGETIMEMFAKFKREMPASVSVDTWDQNQKIVGLFANFAGEKAHVSIITKKLVREWKDQLFHWPAKAAEISEFRNLGFKDVIDANKKLKRSVISEYTINKYLSALGSFCKYLRGSGIIDDDVMGLYLQLDKSKKIIVPYSDAQLRTLFSSPLFHLCSGDGREHTVGAVACRDWRYWLLLIALYSGARLGEIAQLLVADVKAIQGHQCFHICRDGERQKSVKTGGSERVAPLHPELMRLGFLEYHTKMRRDGHVSLFPEIKPDARGFMSGRPSKFFNAYFKAIGIKTDRSVNVHSLRHGIADAFRRAGYLDEQFGMLLGHVKATTTQRYGILTHGDITSRIAMISSVSFPTVTAALQIEARLADPAEHV